MLRAFLFLLSIVTDYETLADIARYSFMVAVVSAIVLGCVGACLALRYWLASGNRANAGAATRMDSSSPSYSL